MLNYRLGITLPLLLTHFVLIGCDSNSSRNNTVTPDPQGETIAISGTAAKGLIFGGIVNIHPIVNGVLDTRASLGNTTTGDDGTYTINIDEYDGNPFVVRVSATDTTTMRCDLAAGCGNDIPFGGTLPLGGTGFNLDAIVPPVSNENVSVNLSVLTDTASAVALNTLGAGGSNAIEEITMAISDANSSVANRFGILGNLTTLPTVDLTNPNALTDTAQNILEYNLLSAGIIEALIGGSNETSITEAVNNFATQYVDQGGLADTEDTESVTVTLSEVLAQASSIIDAIQTVDKGNTLDLASLETLIDANQTFNENGSTDPSNGIPTEGTLNELDAVKAMVADIRSLDTELSAPFSDKADRVSDLFDNDPGAALMAIGKASEAIVEAWDAHDEDDSITSHTHTESGLSVTISTMETAVTYSVDGSVIVEEESVAVMISTVDSNSNINVSENDPVATDDGTSQTSTTAGQVDLDIMGTAITDSLVLTVNSGELTAVDLSLVRDNSSINGFDEQQQSTSTETDTIDNSLSSITIALSASIAENTEPAASFTGEIEFTMAGVNQEDATTATFSSGDFGTRWTETWTRTFGFERASFSLGGTFTGADASSLEASFALTIEPGELDFTCNGSNNTEEACTEETEDTYVDVSYAVSLELNEAGLDNDVTASISGSRSGLEDLTTSASIQSGAIILNISYDTDNATETSETFTVTNQANVLLTVVDSDDGLSGNIVYNDTVYATLSDSLGFFAVSYIDGTNESL